MGNSYYIKSYYIKVENGNIKLPQEFLEKLEIKENDTIEITRIGEVDMQLSVVEEWDCIDGKPKLDDYCYKCEFCERCERTTRYNNRMV